MGSIRRRRSRLKASMARSDGEYVEACKLDDRRAVKVPKRMIERTLTEDDVAAMLAWLE